MVSTTLSNACYRDRTDDLILTMDALYRLSYTGRCSRQEVIPATWFFKEELKWVVYFDSGRQHYQMPITGIEPATSSLPWMRSTD